MLVQQTAVDAVGSGEISLPCKHTQTQLSSTIEGQQKGWMSDQPSHGPPRRRCFSVFVRQSRFHPAYPKHLSGP